MKEGKVERDRAIKCLRRAGWSYREIGDVFGLSYEGIRLICNNPNAGIDTLSIKRECGISECQNTFIPRKGGHPQKFCSGACKAKAYRRRKELVA